MNIWTRTMDNEQRTWPTVTSIWSMDIWFLCSKLIEYRLTSVSFAIDSVLRRGNWFLNSRSCLSNLQLCHGIVIRLVYTSNQCQGHQILMLCHCFTITFLFQELFPYFTMPNNKHELSLRLWIFHFIFISWCTMNCNEDKKKIGKTCEMGQTEKNRKTGKTFKNNRIGFFVIETLIVLINKKSNQNWKQ